MKKNQLNRVFLDPRLSAAAVLAAVGIGCSMLGGGADTASNSKSGKGFSAEQVCQLLAHPEFENKSSYNGESCSGSTYFGAKDAPAGNRSAFSYYVLGDKDTVQKINLSMSRRPDGTTFFAAQGNAVTKMISGQPLPKEIEDAITAILPASGGLAGYGDRFTTSAVAGNAKVELVRTNSDQGFTLTFQF
jgi:hypothetical protein